MPVVGWCMALLVATAFETAAADELEQLSWLVGSWRSEVNDVVIEEHWIESSGGLMLGVSRTVADKKAIGFEFLRIEIRPVDVVYVAQPDGRAGVDFTLTKLGDSDVVFENPDHDHPKTIRYELVGDRTLRARIEGDEGVQEFEFQRISESLTRER